MKRILMLGLLVGLALPGIWLSGCSQQESAPATDEVVQEPTDVPVAPEPTEEAQADQPDDSGAADAGGDCVAVELPAVDPLEVAGDITTAGSSTVFPLSEAVADMFTRDGYMGRITIDSIGSGAGFDRFCATGETDVSNASRAIKDTEIESCRAIGREPLEFRIATDAIAVVVGTENDFVDDLSMEELALVFGAAETWADVRPDWPAEPIERFTPGTDSGTFDFFVEEVFGEDPAPALNASNLQLSEDDNFLVTGVEGGPYAIGYFGYAYYAENEDQLKAVAVNGVAPSSSSVDDGTYPLARPLFLYATAEIMTEKPQVAAFLNYYLTNVDDAVGQVGYFPASCDALNNSKTAWIVAAGE